jgi:hypothetical protein
MQPTKKEKLPPFLRMDLISSEDKRRLGIFIRRCKNYTLQESELHKSVAQSLIKKGFIVRMGDGRLIVKLPVYDAYKSAFCRVASLVGKGE